MSTATTPSVALLYVSESYCLSTDLVFPRGVSLEQLVEVLRSERATGRLVIDLSQGGVNAVTFHQQHRVVEK